MDSPDRLADSITAAVRSIDPEMPVTLARLMSSLVFGVGASDPATYLIITALLGAVAAFACLLPARRLRRGEGWPWATPRPPAVVGIDCRRD